MKALANTQPTPPIDSLPQPLARKRLAELHQANSDKETLITSLEDQVGQLQKNNKTLREEIAKQEQEWEAVREKEEEKSEQEEQEMNDWIENVQKMNGLPPGAIDSLLTVQFQGEQEICPSCFQELAQGTMCTYLPCAHLYHRQCIENHLKVNRFCLACQEPVVL